MDEELLQRAEQKRTHRKKIPRTILLAAAIAALCVLAGFAFRLWNEGLASEYGADEEAQKTMLQSGMTSFIC